MVLDTAVTFDDEIRQWSERTSGGRFERVDSAGITQDTPNSSAIAPSLMVGRPPNAWLAFLENKAQERRSTEVALSTS